MISKAPAPNHRLGVHSMGAGAQLCLPLRPGPVGQRERIAPLRWWTAGCGIEGKLSPAKDHQS